MSGGTVLIVARVDVGFNRWIREEAIKRGCDIQEVVLRPLRRERDALERAGKPYRQVRLHKLALDTRGLVKYCLVAVWRGLKAIQRGCRHGFGVIWYNEE